MKTKRIVALALAGALALGAVTPAFAEEGKDAKVVDTTITAEKAQKAWEKVYQAQTALVAEAKENVAKLQAEYNKFKKDKDTTNMERKGAQGEVQKAEDAIEANKKLIEDEKAGAKFYEDEIVKARAEFVTNKAENPKAEAALGNAKEYDAVIKQANKRGDTDREAELNKLKNLFMYHAYDASNGKKYTIPEMIANKDWHLEEMKKYQNLANDLQTVLDQKNEALAKAEAAYKVNEQGFIQKEIDLRDAKDDLDKKEDVLTRLGSIKKDRTIELVKKETNPKWIAFAEKDLAGYLVGKYLEAGLISKENVKELKLDSRVLDVYNDILGDEGKVSEESSQEEESKKPDESKPNEEKPGTSEETPAPVVPGNKDNTATDNKDNKDNKKDNKKATKKSKKAPKTGDIAVLAYAGTAVLAAGAYVASKKRK